MFNLSAVNVALKRDRMVAETAARLTDSGARRR
jgi:hypothetical protein